MRSDLTDIAVQLHAESEKAVLVSDTGERADAVWLPKSQIEIERKGHGSAAIVTLPAWLAEQKGLV